MFDPQNIDGMAKIDQTKLSISKSQINETFLKYKATQAETLKKRAEFAEAFTNIKIQKVLTPFKLYFDDSQTQITETSISIVPLLRYLVISKIQHLSEIQYEIDVFERKLANVNGQPIHQFIDQILTKQQVSIQALFDKVYKFVISQEIKKQLLKPVLTQIYKILQTKFSFIVSPENLIYAMLNTKHDNLFINQTQIKEKHNLLVKQITKKNSDADKKSFASNTIMSIAYLILKRRKKILNSDHFFTVISDEDVYDYDDVINTSFDQQVEACEKILKNK